MYICHKTIQSNESHFLSMCSLSDTKTITQNSTMTEKQDH